jgi:hypothetical protein
VSVTNPEKPQEKAVKKKKMTILAITIPALSTFLVFLGVLLIFLASRIKPYSGIGHHRIGYNRFKGFFAGISVILIGIFLLIKHLFF